MAKLKVLLAGAAVLVVVGVATPGALVTLVAFAWPHTWAWRSLGPGRLAVLALDVLAWVAWATYAVSLLRDVVARVRAQRSQADLGSGPRARIAGWVAGLVLLLLPASALLGATAAGAAPSAHHGVVATAATSSTSATATTTTPGPAAAPVPQVSTYTVQPGDCLSVIAEKLYGDEGAWHEIWSANADAQMNDGLRFSDPNLILPGWQLQVPGVTTPAAPPTAAPTAGPQSVSGSEAQPAGPGADGTTNRPAGSTPTTAPPAAWPRRGSTTKRVPHDHALQGPGTSPTAVATDGSGHASPPAAAASAPSDPMVHWVPEAVALGLSTLAAAALARRIRRTRALSRGARGDDEVVPEPSEAARGLEELAAPFAGAPVLDRLELANRHLTGALREAGRAADAPGIDLVRVGPAGVELFLAAPCDWAPGSFEATGGGERWRLPSEIDRTALSAASAGELAWLPALLAVGDDPTGSYLVPLEPGKIVAVEGPDAAGVLRALVSTASCWPWAEQVVVTEDPVLAQAEVRLAEGQDDVFERGRIVFTGDPSELSPATRARVGILGGGIADHDVRIATAGDRAVIEPFGIAVRPCSLDPETAESIEEATDPVASAPVPAPSTAVARRAEIVPAGAVEVRLLTETPTIDGLAKPLPSDKAVRATELIAWLGLRGATGATSATIMDKRIAGAGSPKTVYNIVSAARAALGETASGEPRMVVDRTTGSYRVSGDVTVDVLRFAEMAEAGAGAEDPAAAAVLCEAALGLIEGEPVGNGSGRYGWWAGSWEARVARLAVKAARRLVELAESGEVDLESARWGVERARLAAAGEEELLRVGMELEAIAQNPAGVEREWQTARDQAEDLEPGSWPAEDTEALYNAIKRRWQRSDAAPALARTGR